DRHQRPCAGKICRRVADAARDRLGEARIAVKIDAGREGDLGARQPQQLLALAVELRQLRHRGDLAEQLGIGVAALLDGVDIGARDAADLAFQLAHRLVDALGGGFRLLGHAFDQRGLGGAIADPGLGQAVHRQHEHDEADQRHHVFGEQALAQKPDLVLDRDHPDPRACRLGLAATRGSRPGRGSSTNRGGRPGRRGAWLPPGPSAEALAKADVDGAGKGGSEWALRSSWPGIAVRRTASLPLAYDPAIHVLEPKRKAWMPGSRPGMTSVPTGETADAARHSWSDSPAAPA